MSKGNRRLCVPRAVSRRIASPAWLRLYGFFLSSLQLHHHTCAVEAYTFKRGHQGTRSTFPSKRRRAQVLQHSINRGEQHGDQQTGALFKKVRKVGEQEKMQQNGDAGTGDEAFAEITRGRQDYHAQEGIKSQNQKKKLVEHDRHQQNGTASQQVASPSVKDYFDVVENKLWQLRRKVQESANACKADPDYEFEPSGTPPADAQLFGKLGECNPTDACFAMGTKNARVSYQKVAVTDPEDCLSRAIARLLLHESKKTAEQDGSTSTKLLRTPITEDAKDATGSDLGFATVVLEKPLGGGAPFVARWPVSDQQVNTNSAAPWYVKTFTSGVSKSLVIALDRSGSMGETESWGDARKAAAAVLNSLDATDRFFLMTYQHPVQFSAFEFVHPTEAHLEAANRWLELQVPIGGAHDRPDAEFGIGTAVAIGTQGVVPKEWRAKIRETVKDTDNDDRELPPEPAEDDIGSTTSCPRAALNRCEKTVVLVMSDENFPPSHLDDPKYGSWLREGLLGATAKLAEGEDPAVHLNVYRFQAALRDEVPTVAGPYQSIVAHYDGQAEVVTGHAGDLAERMARYWRKLLAGTGAGAARVVWTAHEDAEGRHLTACVPLASDYFAAPADPTMSSAGGPLPPGLVCVDPRAVLSLSMVQLQCQDGFAEELSKRLTGGGACDVREQKERRERYCKNLSAALAEEKSYLTQVYDFLISMKDLEWSAKTLSEAMASALTLVPCYGCDVDTETTAEMDEQLQQHASQPGEVFYYTRSCPEASTGQCSERLEVEWRKSYPSPDLYNERVNGTSGDLHGAMSAEHDVNHILPQVTTLPGNQTCEKSRPPVPPLVPNVEVNDELEKIDVNWDDTYKEEPVEKDSPVPSDEHDDSDLWARILAGLALLFALLLLLLAFLCPRNNDQEDDPDLASGGKADRGGGDDKKVRQSLSPAAADRLSKGEGNPRASLVGEALAYDFGVVETALLTAGLSRGFAKKLAEQITDRAVEEEAELLKPEDEKDLAILARLGLDFGEPEEVGRFRGFLAAVANAQAARSRPEPTLRACPLEEARARFLTAGFSEETAGFLAASMGKKAREAEVALALSAEEKKELRAEGRDLELLGEVERTQGFYGFAYHPGKGKKPHGRMEACTVDEALDRLLEKGFSDDAANYLAKTFVKKTEAVETGLSLSADDRRELGAQGKDLKLLDKLERAHAFAGFVYVHEYTTSTKGEKSPTVQTLTVEQARDRFLDAGFSKKVAGLLAKKLVAKAAKKGLNLVLSAAEREALGAEGRDLDILADMERTQGWAGIAYKQGQRGPPAVEVCTEEEMRTRLVQAGFTEKTAGVLAVKLAEKARKVDLSLSAKEQAQVLGKTARTRDRMLMAQLERDDWLGFAYAVEAPPAIDLGAIAEPAFGGTEHALAVSFFKKMMPPRKVRAGGKEKSARRETKKSAQMTSSVKRMSGIKLQETTSGGKDTSSSAGEDGEDAPHGGKKSGKATASKKSGKQGTSSENKDTATSSAEEDEEQAPRAGKKSAKATSSKKGGGRANKQAAALPPGLLGKAEEALQAIGFTRRQAAVLGQKIAGTAEDALGSDAFLLTEDEKRVATDGLSGATIHDLEDLVAELVHQKADFFKEYLENADGNITSGQDKSAEPLSLLADTVLDPNKKTKGKPKKRAGAAAKK